MPFLSDFETNRMALKAKLKIYLFLLYWFRFWSIIWSKGALDMTQNHLKVIGTYILAIAQTHSSKSSFQKFWARTPLGMVKIKFYVVFDMLFLICCF